MKIERFVFTTSFLTLLFLTSEAQNNSAKNLPAGAVRTTVGGYTMRARINGKLCNASFMLPPETAEQIVGFYDGDKYIGLPYNKSNFVVGKKLSFDDANADLTTNDKVQVWNGRDGVMEITSVNANWVEGKFFFTGHSYDAKHTITVTAGFFRIPLKGK